MKNIYFFFLAFLLFTQCKDQQQVSSLKYTPAELLDRPEKLQYFNEWSDTRNEYADLIHELKKNPEAINALNRLTNLFIKEARITGEHGHYYNAALKSIAHALSTKKISNDQKFLALGAKASVELSLHSFKSALETAQQALVLNPYNAQIYGVLVDAYVELGQYEEAVEAADKMMNIRPDLRSYSRISYLREIHGMPEDAMIAMKMAVEAGSPGSEEKSWAALQLAQLFLRYDKIKETEIILNQILSERSDYPFAKASLAEVYVKQNKLQLAENTLIEACAIIPEVGFYVQLAELYKIQGREEELQTTLKEILDMLKDDSENGHDMSLEYANIYLEFFNDADKALSFLQTDQNTRPDNIDINRLLAKIYYLKKDKSKANTYLTKALNTRTLHPEVKSLEKEIIQL